MPLTRRAAITGALAYSRILGANDRIGVGFIGYGLIGAQHVYDFKDQPDTDLVGLADCYQPRLEAGLKACGANARGYADFRRLLDDKHVDAIVVCTPDHWHALMTMMACAAGKDVYVEKPMTLFVREGRWMTQVARRHNRIVHVGVQQRSGKHYQAARDLVRSGYLGKVHSVRAAAFRNIMPGFKPDASRVDPKEFDYEMWLGPAPKREYTPLRGIYHFRWFWDYSGGQMTNLGAHQVDIAHWYLDLAGPRRVASFGGRYALEDGGETPDTQDALFDYGALTMLWSHREASAGSRAGAGLEVFGTKGSLVIGRTGFRVLGDAKIPTENAVPRFAGGDLPGAPERTSAPAEKWIEPRQMDGSSPQQFHEHARNFLDAVKSRQRSIADVEEGHRVATACHLANISLRLGRQIVWDAQREEIVNDREAAAMLERPYRAPWDIVLQSLVK